MRKRIVAAFLLLVFVMGSVSAFAHDKQDEHDKDLKYALFGSREKVLSGDENLIFNAIADAAALMIDQFSANDSQRQKEGTYNELQDDLRKLGLPALTDSFDDLNLNSRIAANGKNITANTHRRYTHLGWNYKNYPNEEFWVKRKQILLHTVNWTLFNDKALLSQVPWLSDVIYSPSEQCDAFCAVIYYIHILGDHIEGNDPEKLTDLEPLIQYTSLSTPGIITELKEQFGIVFIAQKDSWTYAAMMEALSDLEIRAEQNCHVWDAVNTKERCAINQKYANELLDILANYLPKLLKEEPFFSKHFKVFK